MKALTFQGKQSIEYTSIPDPEILQAQDAIVKVDCCAVCGSDLHVYHEREKGLDHGTVMGHEFTGEVVAVGKEVKQLQIGDKVVSPFSTSCGQCYYCNIGLTARCTQGQLYGWVEGDQGLHGGQAEYVRVPLAEGTLVKYNQGLSPEQALFAGDILSTGYYCADQVNIQPDGNYAVIGCGPVGLMSIISAKEMGAQTIFAIDQIPERLAKAEEFGAIPINFSQIDVAAHLKELSKGIGMDGVMEAVGNPAAARMAYELIRYGGSISTVGVHTSSGFAFSPAEAYDKNLQYKVGRCPARHYMKTSLEIIESGRHDLDGIISHRMKLHEGSEAYRIFDKKQDNCLKVILYP